MRSHTVPQRLLKQFAYDDPITGSLRLWKYAKGRAPYPNASPKTATRVDGYFAVAKDAEIEARTEDRLAREIEDPVNAFLASFSDACFVLNASQREQMTRYISLLFQRCTARRSAAGYIQEVKAYAFKKFLENDTQLATVAAHWGINAYLNQLRMPLITPHDVAQAAKRMRDKILEPSAEQDAFVTGLVSVIAFLDEPMFNGEWLAIRTTPDKPFILADAPVVTWERFEDGKLSFGIGVHQSNVEVLLPVSPTTCLHILPCVKRSRKVLVPTVREVNSGEAAFAHQACFTNIRSKEIDDIVQNCGGTVRFGQNAFMLWHQNYDNIVFDFLMKR